MDQKCYGTNGPRKRILVVDDEEEVLLLLTSRLRSWGFEVLVARSGEEGLRAAEERQPELVLLDIVMPSMRGREVCFLLKTNPKTAHIPVVFLTGLAMSDHVEAGIQAGAADYVTKPFDPRDLRERIEDCLCCRRYAVGENRRWVMTE